MAITVINEAQLSPAQARFALEHDAHLGISCCSERPEVFLYREDPWATYRWLVDRSGQLLESEIFRKSPQEATDDYAANVQSRSIVRCGR
jgi:hypothetical protein